MTRRLDKLKRVRLIPGLLIGLGIALVLSLPIFLPLKPLQVLQLTLADLLVMKEGGPMLGVRPARRDIVVIVADEKTHKELRWHTRQDIWKEDIELYALLVGQGAKVVADTRILFEDSPGVKEVLDEIVALRGKGVIFRDIRVELTPWFAEKKEEYLRHVAHNLFRFDSGYDLTQNIRYYPILGYNTNEGLYETMALKIAKTALGLSLEIQRSSRELVEKVWRSELKRLGLLPAEMETSIQEIKDTRSYLLTPGRPFPWVFHPSKETPTTILPAALWINYIGPPGSFPTLS
ncbi:MAG: hypothetical protein ACE5JU_15950, partial [Candidatus Binatia bacterium]